MVIGHDRQAARRHQRWQQPTIPTAPAVIVGYDERSTTATVRWAAELAGRLGGRLHIVHALPAPNPEALPAGPALGVPYPVVDPETADLTRASRERWLTEELGDQLAGLDVPWSCSVEIGNPADVIAHRAEEARASFVVVGARCTGLAAAFERLLSGSTVRELEHELEHEHRHGRAHPGWGLLIVPHDDRP